MKPSTVIAAGLAALSLSACVGTPAAYEPTAVKTVNDHKGYLTREQIQALAAAVPPPPTAGSAEEAADHSLSDTYRSLENTDRWWLATSHAEVRSPYALQHFDCALGVRFDPAREQTPASARLLQRLFEDAEAASSLVKLRAYRARPVGDDPQRAACQTVSANGRASASYPSGSASVAAAYGAAMAEIAPDTAEAAKKAGHDIASSRAICGMHYPRDVAAGEALGQALFALAGQTPAFQADLAAARTEVANLRASGATNPGCAAERAALLQTP